MILRRSKRGLGKDFPDRKARPLLQLEVTVDARVEFQVHLRRLSQVRLLALVPCGCISSAITPLAKAELDCHWAVIWPNFASLLETSSFDILYIS